MPNDQRLYFIRILQAAFEQRDRIEALKKALEEITSLGKEPGYREGFQNFQKFVSALDDQTVLDEYFQQDARSEYLEARILDMLTDTFSGTEDEKRALTKLIQDDPELAGSLELMRTNLASLLTENIEVTIEVEKGGLSFGLYRLEKGFHRIVIPGIQAGEYTIKLSTGLLLWEGQLEAEQLLWHLAFPGQKLPAAAESRRLSQQATLTIELMDGEIRLVVLPGLESGTILLNFTGSHAS